MKPINKEMNKIATYNSVFEFLEKNKDRIFRFWVYKRIFTPLEMEQKYIDQGEFEECRAKLGIIREIIILPDDDLLLGFYIPSTETADEEDEYRHCYPDPRSYGQASGDRGRSLHPCRFG